MKCELCGKTYTASNLLVDHYVQEHGLTKTPLRNSNFRRKLICAKCDAGFANNMMYGAHMSEEHGIQLTSVTLQFSSQEELMEWKNRIEEDGYNFVVRSSRKQGLNQNRTTYYVCNRAGAVRLRISNENRKRKLKTQGSCKTNYHCPARIYVNYNPDGTFTVTYCGTHIGHEKELQHLQIPVHERNKIAEKLAANVPLETIMQNIKQLTPGKDVKRVNLLTIHDIHNIRARYALDNTDFINVEKWIENEKAAEDSCILLYKAKGALSDHPELKNEDFLLGIMTDQQARVLQHHGNYIVSLDSSHDTNAYGFELVSLLVQDDKKQCYACAFLISSTTGRVALDIFLDAVKGRVGPLSPIVLLTDSEPMFYNSWKDNMCDCNRVFFYPSNSWNKMLICTVTNESLRLETSQALNELLNETDETHFEQLLPVIAMKLCRQEETKEFGTYFKANFLKTSQQWASCYRISAGLELELDNLHDLLRCTFLKGQKIRRMDRTIAALMKLASFKGLGRLKNLAKDKISKKVVSPKERRGAFSPIGREDELEKGTPSVVETQYDESMFDDDLEVCDSPDASLEALKEDFLTEVHSILEDCQSPEQVEFLRGVLTKSKGHLQEMGKEEVTALYSSTSKIEPVTNTSPKNYTMKVRPYKEDEENGRVVHYTLLPVYKNDNTEVEAIVVDDNRVKAGNSDYMTLELNDINQVVECGEEQTLEIDAVVM